jgi:hypothetical protein
LVAEPKPEVVVLGDAGGFLEEAAEGAEAEALDRVVDDLRGDADAPENAVHVAAVALDQPCSAGGRRRQDARAGTRPLLVPVQHRGLAFFWLCAALPGSANRGRLLSRPRVPEGHFHCKFMPLVTGKIAFAGTRIPDVKFSSHAVKRTLCGFR